jgi:hypothetical protein
VFGFERLNSVVYCREFLCSTRTIGKGEWG